MSPIVPRVEIVKNQVAIFANFDPINQYNLLRYSQGCKENLTTNWKNCEINYKTDQMKSISNDFSSSCLPEIVDYFPLIC